MLLAQWQQWSLRLQVTPAGLFALADETRNPHLTVQAEDADILQLARQAMWASVPRPISVAMRNWPRWSIG